MRVFERSPSSRGLMIGLMVLVFIAGQVTIHSSLAAPVAKQTSQPVLSSNLLSNSQFVFGPAARAFDLVGYLERRQSPLLADAAFIESWSAYASVNPQVVLALLELDGRQVTYGWGASLLPEGRDTAVEDLVMGLAERFYEHLYAYGERATASVAAKPAPAVTLQDGTTAWIDPHATSATFALLDTLSRTLTPADFASAANPEAAGSFVTIWQELFPGSDPFDESVAITPDGAPPADLLQFPFPLGQTWWFNGAHNWSGSGATYGKPYSSMDFFTSAESCSAPPAGDWSVAAAAGSGYHPNGRSCWYRIDHAGGWSTSYYHLLKMVGNGSVVVNQNLGTIACETCAGGFASSPHVHFSLLYNGAYIDLEGVKLSGWTVHSGNGDYESGSLEKDGVQKKPYSSVRNDGAGTSAPAPTVTLTSIATRTPMPTGTLAATVTVTATVTSTPAPALTLTPEPGETQTPAPTATSSAPPPGKIVSPEAGLLVRSCPVRLVAEVDRPETVAEVRFWVTYGGTTRQVGADDYGGDGWQKDWDCQDAPDGGVSLSITLVDASQEAVAGGGGQVPVTLSKDCKVGTYRTAFFANEALEDSPASSWCKASAVSYDWGTGSPGAGVSGDDSFSARFRGSFQFEHGVYRFTGESDDGVRVWVDRTLALDDWRDHDMGMDPFQFIWTLPAGTHEVWLDYYERTGSAGVRLSWEKTDIEPPKIYLPIVKK